MNHSAWTDFFDVISESVYFLQLELGLQFCLAQRTIEFINGYIGRTPALSARKSSSQALGDWMSSAS
jgi:hypothetical protein